MRIFLICKDFLPKNGGISIMMHHIANALADRNLDVLVAPPQADGEMPFKYKYQLAKGSWKKWRRGRWYSRLFREHRYRRQLAMLIEEFKPDALLLGDQAYTGQYAEASIWASNHYGIPMGLFCHGKDVCKKLVVLPPRYRELASLIFGPIAGHSPHQRIRKLFRSADVIFANSQYTANLVRSFSDRSAVVTGCGLNEVDWQREAELSPSFDPGLKQARREELGFDSRKMIVFIGRLVTRKNVGILLDVLKEMENVQMAVIGDGPSGPELKAKAGKLNLDDRVTWLGQVDEERKWRVLRASDVLCLPAKEGASGDVEGFGIVLLEAAAAATPVVAAASGGMPEVVEDGESGLLWHHPDNPDTAELTASLNRLLNDRQLAERCVSQARERIREEFNWSKIAKKVIDKLMEQQGV